MFGKAVQRGSAPNGGEQPPVQRLIGFEVEYQVPTYGQGAEEVTLKADAAAADSRIKLFLFGGLAYGTELGGSAKVGENSFRITTDHNNAISREPIRAKLAAMGLLDPADKADRDASSNLEYVTSPVDELAKGSDKVLGTMIDQVADHAKTTFPLATQDQWNPLTAPASKVATGTPVDRMKTWLTAEHFKTVEPTIKEFQSNILDSCYLQATVGILPSAIVELFSRAKGEDSLHMTGGQFTQIYEGVTNVITEVSGAVKEDKYIKGLQEKSQTEALASLGGMIRLLAMYLIGEALSQTSAFPGGTIKNAVPFLVKVDPAQVSKAGPSKMLLNKVPDDFVSTLAGVLGKQKEFTVDYWQRELGYAARDREGKWVTTGTMTDLVRMFLQGKSPAATQARTGSQLDKLDEVKELTHDLFEETFALSGIPLEYRYIKARPTATALKAELLKLIAEARAINLSRVSEDKKKLIEKQVKE